MLGRSIHRGTAKSNERGESDDQRNTTDQARMASVRTCDPALIGGLLNDRTDLSRGVALITSRASHEMVQKAASVGIEMLIAVSAPTTLAVRLAKDTGVTRIAFARGERYTVCSGSERIIAHEALV
jgi:formate dehydrogenase accessory protein FdhD